MHQWVPSRLGHGETMCSLCSITNREAAVHGLLDECARDTDRSGEVGQTAKQAGPVGREPGPSASEASPKQEAR